MRQTALGRVLIRVCAYLCALIVAVLAAGALYDAVGDVSVSAAEWMDRLFFDGDPHHQSDLEYQVCATTFWFVELAWLSPCAIAVYWGFCRLITSRRERSGESQPTCRNCGYILHGLPHNRCPECGAVNDGADHTERRSDLAKPTRRRAIRIAGMALALLGAPLLVVRLAERWLLDNVHEVVGGFIQRTFLPLTDHLNYWGSGYVINCAECCVWVVAHVTVLIAVWEIALALSRRGRIPPPLQGGDWLED